MSNLVSSIPVRFSTVTGENIISISQTGNENKFQLSQASGQNGVDIVKSAGAALAAVTNAGAIPVEIKNASLTVVIATDETPKYDYGTQADIDENLGFATIQFTDIPAGVTGKLMKIQGFCQNHCFVEVQTWDGSVATTVAVTGNSVGGGAFEIQFLDKSNVTQAGNASSRRFQVKITNLDLTKKADGHAQGWWIEE